VQTWTVEGNWLPGETITVAVGGKAIITVADSTSIEQLVDAVRAALAASAIPEFQEIAWASSPITIVGTAKTAGLPFVVTFNTNSVSGTINGASMTTGTATIASAGPADASTLANWSTGTLPQSGDDLVFAGTSADCLYGAGALAGLRFASLTIDLSYSGKLGLSYSNPARYVEYRERYLQIGAAIIDIGNGPGNGSGRINLDCGAVQTVVTLNGSGPPSEAGSRSVNWKGTHPANVLNLNKGSFAAAPCLGEMATVATWNQSYQNDPHHDVDAFAGRGCTIATINKTGGALVVNSGFVTLNHGPGDAGECSLAAGAPGTLNVTGGNVRYRTGGAYAAITTGDSGLVDFAPGIGTVIGGAIACWPGSGSINDPGQRIAPETAISLMGRLSDFPNLNLGPILEIIRPAAGQRFASAAPASVGPAPGMAAGAAGMEGQSNV
jgi:hypothetical protein